ncbi:MAG: hypothetical protein GC160_12050 [Acidobacteria bacterium]|nr:hypothetical protein [Acidobacteriota bacterium]
MGDSSTRRMFLAALAAAPALPQSPKLTAGAVIDLIKANVGVPWAEKTVDRIIAGLAETPVTGVATTMMATYDVVRRASKAGLNLVVTHEPTFYSHQDDVEKLHDDALYQEKLAFLNDNHMVVFHFHDHWHRRKPDGIAYGMMRELGWERYVDPENQRRFTLPPTPLRAVAEHVRAKLGASTVRVVGDPKLEVRRVAASWGYSSQFPAIPILANPDVDVFVCGETREWEAVEYAADQATAGRKKGLIVIGHVASEQAGMKYCAEWLRTFLPAMPVELIATREPFWSPGAA